MNKMFVRTLLNMKDKCPTIFLTFGRISNWLHAKFPSTVACHVPLEIHKVEVGQMMKNNTQ